MPEPVLVERLAMVGHAIAERQRAGGWTHSVRIVAVTKGHGPEAVRAAAAVGVKMVGENRVQEALTKQEQCRDVDLAWHLIGTLQRNKVRHAAGRFAMIHSVDRLDLAQDIDARTPDGIRQSVLVQVNCSGEAQKGGVAPGALRELLDGLRRLARLDVQGLMTMAAFTDDEPTQRRTFAMLRALRDTMRTDGHALAELSMGMSGDFGAAVEEGATMVRLGTVLFGVREAHD